MCLLRAPTNTAVFIRNRANVRLDVPVGDRSRAYLQLSFRVCCRWYHRRPYHQQFLLLVLLLSRRHRLRLHVSFLALSLQPLPLLRSRPRRPRSWPWRPLFVVAADCAAAASAVRSPCRRIPLADWCRRPSWLWRGTTKAPSRGRREAQSGLD